MADTEMNDAVAEPTGEKAVLDRNVSSDEESDDEEVMLNATLEVCVASHLAFPDHSRVAFIVSRDCDSKPPPTPLAHSRRM